MELGLSTRYGRSQQRVQDWDVECAAEKALVEIPKYVDGLREFRKELKLCYKKLLCDPKLEHIRWRVSCFGRLYRELHLQVISHAQPPAKRGVLIA